MGIKDKNKKYNIINTQDKSNTIIYRQDLQLQNIAIDHATLHDRERVFPNSLLLRAIAIIQHQSNARAACAFALLARYFAVISRSAC